MNDKTVRIYNLQTQKSLEIPATELAPGYVKAQVEGVEGPVFIKANDSQLSREKHNHDLSELIPTLRDIYDKVKAVYRITWEKWIDGFQFDANPEREIAIWMVIAEKYFALTEGKQLSLDVRKEYFQIILSTVNNGPAIALEVVKLKHVSKTQAKHIVAFVTNAVDGDA